MAKRRYLSMTIKVSVAPGVTAAQARREVRTRVNELSGWYSHLEDSDVRVARIDAGGVVSKDS